MPASREGFTARILRNGLTAPAGVGFLVDETHIVTCAHVINTALGRDKRTQSKPEPTVRIGVDFPMLGNLGEAPMRRCRVEAWLPPPTTGTTGGDVAGLVIVGDDLPAGAGPARLAGQPSRRDLVVKVFGYPGDPPRHDHGVWTQAHLQGAVGGGILQLDTDTEAAIRVQPGYSGSAIVASGDEGDEVLGMLAVASLADGRDAYAITAAQLANAWPAVLDRVIVPPCPYRGLKAFTADDAEAGVFVGREDEIRQLQEMLREHALVIVTGPSGVGKSSLVNGGLVRAYDDSGWITRIIQPGPLPIEAICRAFFTVEHPDRKPTVDELGRWVDRLRSEGLTSAGAKLAMAAGQPILLCLDQFEQVLDSGICTPQTSTDFLELLLALRSSSGDHLQIACTLRADFYSHLLQYPDAGACLRDRFFPLSPMSLDRMERVITEPAEVRGVHYQAGLAALIARDAGDGGGLPLLGFALTELWPLQQRRQITFAEYNSVRGVMGALCAYAERVYDELMASFTSDQVRRVMLTLVRSRGGAAEATRTVVTRELLGRDWPVAEALAGGRLVIMGHDSVKDDDYAQIAHEALIREWPRLAAWVDEDAGFQHWLTALEERASDGEFLPDTRLAEADRWLAERADDVPAEVKQLISDSKSEWQRRISELERARKDAEEAAQQAKEAARQAEARRLAAAAELALASPSISLQVPIALAIESLRLSPGFEADTAVRHAIRLAPIQRSRLDHDKAVVGVVFSPDGTRIATAGSDARVFNAATGAEICRLGHHGAMAAVAFSPDGTRVATANDDRSARVFNAATGAEIRRLDHDGPVRGVVFSPDGTRIATASSDGSARVFNAATGAEICRLGQHNGAVATVVFSPDGAWVATASSDGSARVFDASAGAEIRRLDHDGPVRGVVFSPDGTRIATASDDGSARVFDASAGAEIRRLDHDGPVRGVVFSPDGTRIATASDDGSARVFDASAGAEIRRLGQHDGAVAAVVFSPDGTRIATANSDGSARVFYAATGAEICHLDHDDAVTGVVFSPDGTCVATASSDGSAQVFNAATGAEIRRLDHDGPVRGVVFSPDGTRIATASSDGSARVFDASAGAEICRLDHDGPVRGVVFSPDGTWVATASDDGSARVFDASAGAEICRLDHDGPVTGVVFSPDGTRIATANSDGSARVFYAATGAEICHLDHDDAVTGVVFSPDGTRIATASDDGSARVFDAATGAEICRLHHARQVAGVVFSPDGTQVATAVGDLVSRGGSGSGSARVFDSVTGSQICRLDHDGLVTGVVFSPDGTQVATASDDRSARVWDVASGAEICRLDHDSWVAAVVFSPDGTQVATAVGAPVSRGGRGTARVFDAASGAEICRLDHDSWVAAVVFSPDGTQVATASSDGSARVWGVDHGQLIEQAKGRLIRNLTQQEWRRYFGKEPYRKTRADLP